MMRRSEDDGARCPRDHLERICATALLPFALSAGVALSPAPLARADVTTMAPQSSHRTTVDGWDLSVVLDGEMINAVPNLAGSQNSREAFVTLSARANIDGFGTDAVTSASFVAGYQLGCQVDVSQGLQVGGTGVLSGSLGLNGGAMAAATAGGTGSLGGFAQTNLQPGVIATLPVATMPLVKSVGHLDMQDVHIKVDACGGPVTIRSYATIAVATDIEQTQISVYGDPYLLK